MLAHAFTSVTSLLGLYSHPLALTAQHTIGETPLLDRT